MPLAKEKVFKQGDVIIEEGQPGKNFYLIAEGRVAIRKKIDGAKEKLLAVLDEGTFLGEISLFDQGLRSASVKCIDDSTILEIDGDSFNKLLSSHPALGVKVLRAMMNEMVNRLRKTNEIIRDFVILALYGKK